MSRKPSSEGPEVEVVGGEYIVRFDERVYKRDQQGHYAVRNYSVWLGLGCNSRSRLKKERIDALILAFEKQQRKSA